MKIFNETTFTKKTCPQNKKNISKKLLASKKIHQNRPNPKVMRFHSLKNRPFAPSNPTKRRLPSQFFPTPRKGHGLGQNDPNKQSTRCAFCEFERNPDELDVSENSG